MNEKPISHDLAAAASLRQIFDQQCDKSDAAAASIEPLADGAVIATYTAADRADSPTDIHAELVANTAASRLDVESFATFSAADRNPATPE